MACLCFIKYLMKTINLFHCYKIVLSTTNISWGLVLQFALVLLVFFSHLFIYFKTVLLHMPIPVPSPPVLPPLQPSPPRPPFLGLINGRTAERISSFQIRNLVSFLINVCSDLLCLPPVSETGKDGGGFAL